MQHFEERYGQQTRTDSEERTAEVGWIKARNDKNSAKILTKARCRRTCLISHQFVRFFPAEVRLVKVAYTFGLAAKDHIARGNQKQIARRSFYLKSLKNFSGALFIYKV